jgi:flagellar hook-associated protein 3 FlgL
MRITTASQFERSVDILQQRQQGMQSTQERLISGKRIARPSDDPTQAARAERALASQSRIEASQRALEASRSVMEQSESALGDAVDVMQRVRELVVQAGNGAYADAQRRSIADELRGLRQQLLGIANRSDGAGGYLFAGQGASMPPFVDGSSGVEFKGTAGQMIAAASEVLPLSVDGAATWMKSGSGNGVFETAYEVPADPDHRPAVWIDAGRVTEPGALAADISYSISFGGDADSGYTVTLSPAPADGSPATRAFESGKAIEFDGLAIAITGTPAPGQDTFAIRPSSRNLSPFDVLDQLAEELETPSRTGAQTTQTVQHGLRDVDSTLDTLMSLRSRLGGVLDQTDGIDGRLAEQKVAAQSDRSEAEDLDMVEAVSKFQARQTSYDAALKAYSMVQRLSLFEYIR